MNMSGAAAAAAAAAAATIRSRAWLVGVAKRVRIARVRCRG